MVKILLKYFKISLEILKQQKMPSNIGKSACLPV